MAKHELLSDGERHQLLGIPTERDDLARLYTFEPTDIDPIRLRREDRNRIGIGMQLALFRHPGTTLAQILNRHRKVNGYRSKMLRAAFAYAAWRHAISFHICMASVLSSR
ncbi:DUF4158 domain-containing protein [Mesorhizobium sp. SB112]|uniref:DUF4158 domain-containing protein n=1 Tax=Mesorhizobium sp. SB112 TaxID=3151853 RepID=UPI003264D3AA